MNNIIAILNILLTWPPLIFILILYFLIMFNKPLKNIIQNRFVIRIPSGIEISMQGTEIDREAASKEIIAPKEDLKLKFYG